MEENVEENVEESNILRELKEDAKNLSKNHTNYFEFLDNFNKFVSKIESKN